MIVEKAEEAGYYQITLTFKADEADHCNHLVNLICDVAPYVVDNVTVELDFMEPESGLEMPF